MTVMDEMMKLQQEQQPPEGEDEEGIKSMQLYRNIDRIWNELESLGYSRLSEEEDDKESSSALIPVEEMNNFDCYDYSGGRDLVQVFSLSPREVVLDVGAGLGGPARFLSSKTGVQVVGVELQEDVARLGNELSRRCGMSERVQVLAGDITDPSLDVGTSGSFAGVFSILTILHVPISQRIPLLKRCYDLLKPGGVMYIEDYYIKADKSFRPNEVELLTTQVSVPDGELPSREEYISQCRSAGFQEVEFQDMTPEWTDFVCGRLSGWRVNRQRHIKVHNKRTWFSLERFYSSVVELFEGGSLGGAKLFLKKTE